MYFSKEYEKLKQITVLMLWVFLPFECNAKPWHEREGIISIIVAHQKDKGMGLNNTLPWKLKEDLQHFKRVTMKKPIIMGRRTHESIGRALPQRRNIVLTHDKSYRSPFSGVEVYQSFDEAFDKISEEEEAVIIGGHKIFAEALPYADIIYRTLVEADVKTDTFFPPFHEEDWELAHAEEICEDESNEFSYVIQKLVKRQTDERALIHNFLRTEQ